MHLIQLRLRGLDIPEKLPATLTPVRTTLTVIQPMTTEEWNAYNKTFDWKDTSNSGFMDSMYIIDKLVKEYNTATCVYISLNFMNTYI
jgi:hypothetical protein